MLNLATPIVATNTNRVDVYDQLDRREARNDPRFELTMQFRAWQDRDAVTGTRNVVVDANGVLSAP